MLMAKDKDCETAAKGCVNGIVLLQCDLIIVPYSDSMQYSPEQTVLRKQTLKKLKLQ